MSSIALLGQPNSGKSTVFNALTGSRQRVGNWPGKTVEKCTGYYRDSNDIIEITDLPGSYSLLANSEEEIITRDFIKSGNADLVIVMADASQLSRSLYMLADFSHLNVPAILLLNMMDIVKHQKKSIDAVMLQEKLGIPVLPFVAADLSKYDSLKSLIRSELDHPHRLIISAPEKGAEYAWIDDLLEGIVISEKKDFELSRFDRLATGRISGKLLSVGMMLLAFLGAMIIALPVMGVGMMIPQILTPVLTSLMDTAGVNLFLAQIVSVLIPNVLFFSLAMAGFVLGVNVSFGLLEDIGYIGRIAYIFDALMTKLGVQGKSVCAMMMGLGCTIGGATGSRVIDDYGQRVLTIAMTWTVPCSAIWSVIPIIASMFFGVNMIFVMLGIILFMVIEILIISRVFGRSLSPVEKRNGLLMELPPYHKPHWKNIIFTAFTRALDIFKRALMVIFLISMIVFLFTYSKSGKIEDSWLYLIGTAIEPVTRFFGMGWETFMAFVSSAFSKEATLGVLNAVFSGQGSLVSSTFEAKSIGASAAGSLAAIMPEVVSKAEALAFMFAVSFNVPCIMALSTTYRETHSLKWTARLAGFFMGSALILSCIVYHVAVLFE